MRTPALVEFEDSGVCVYKHWDGYPSGVLPTLAPFVSEFFAARKHDPAYATARYLMRLGVIEARGESANAVRMTGFGVLPKQENADLACWFYLVRRDGSIEVRDSFGGAPVVIVPLGADYTGAARIRECDRP